MVQLPNGGGEKSFAEISWLPKEEKEKIINGMTDDDFKKYELWMDEQKKVTNQRIETKQTELIGTKDANEWKRTELIIEKKEGKRLETELIRTYYAYVTNIEAWASGERAVLSKILEKNFTPPDLKQRVESLLSRKDMK